MKRLGILFLVFISLGLALGFGLVGGVALDRQVLVPAAAHAAAPTDLPPDFGLLPEAWSIIQNSYVDRPAVDPQELARGAVSGMVDALGDTGHSTYLSPEMLQAERTLTEGQFEGIGAEVQMKDGHVVIVAPYDGSPAEKAGLRPGDIIAAVNGQDVSALSLSEVVDLVKGPAGTAVTLTILDPATGQARDVQVVRAEIVLHNVVWAPIPGTQVAHVRIVAFSQGVTGDLRQALLDIQRQGLRGAILDLRNNPGGRLDEAIGVASQFLGSGNVLLEKDAQGQVTPVPVQAGGAATDLPLVVLVNQGSASASEIVAGALQDAHRATLVGETTFGTGTVLQEFPMSDGSALLLAVQEWLTPAGRVIWHHGIAPEISVELPAGADYLLPETEQGMTPAQVQASTDAQLLRGLEELPGSRP